MRVDAGRCPVFQGNGEGTGRVMIGLLSAPPSWCRWGLARCSGGASSSCSCKVPVVSQPMKGTWKISMSRPRNPSGLGSFISPFTPLFVHLASSPNFLLRIPWLFLYSTPHCWEQKSGFRGIFHSIFKSNLKWWSVMRTRRLFGVNDWSRLFINSRFHYKGRGYEHSNAASRMTGGRKEREKEKERAVSCLSLLWSHYFSGFAELCFD